MDNGVNSSSLIEFVRGSACVMQALQDPVNIKNRGARGQLHAGRVREQLCLNSSHSSWHQSRVQISNHFSVLQRKRLPNLNRHPHLLPMRVLSKAHHCKIQRDVAIEKQCRIQMMRVILLIHEPYKAPCRHVLVRDNRVSGHR